MRRPETVVLSSAAAVLIMMVGCSDDGSTTSPSGPAIPSEISAALEMNATSARNAIYAIKAGGAAPAVRRAPPSAAAQTDLLMRVANGTDSSTSTYSCDISGSHTHIYSYGFSGVPRAGTGESWSEEEKNIDIYDNCIDIQSSSILIAGVAETVNIRRRNGRKERSYQDAYNADTNITTHITFESNDYTTIDENNQTLTSRTYTSTHTRRFSSKEDGETWTGTASAAWSTTTSDDGEIVTLDTNSSGILRQGNRLLYGALTIEQEGRQDYSWGRSSRNGFFARYDINSSGDLQLSSTYRFVSFVSEFSSSAQEYNLSVNGSYGDECLGGTVAFKTAALIEEDSVRYLDGDGNTGSNVLPYTGKLTMSGSSTATVTFTADATDHTSALLSVDNNDINVTRWSDLSVRSCVQ